MAKTQEVYSAREFRKQIADGMLSISANRIINGPKANKPRKRSIDLRKDDKVFGAFGFDESDFIFIPGKVYSSKNSKQIWFKKAIKSNWRYRGSMVVPFITDSKPVKSYKKRKASTYSKEADRFRQMLKGRVYPVYVEFIFVTPDRSDWDWNNLTQLVQDLMVAHGWIEDDSVKFMFPVPPLPPVSPYYINKNAGVYIRIR